MRAVFRACADMLANAPKLSCYSLRKSFAVALYRAAGNSVAAVMRAMGHSSEAMSLRYMGLDDTCAEAQAAMVRGAA
jgi:integrase